MKNWNLKLLYKSTTDPQIEKDMQAIEKMCKDFAHDFDVPDKKYLKDENELFQVLTRLETLIAHLECKPNLYFYFLKDIDASNQKAASMLQLLGSRLAKAANNIIFFEVALGAIPKAQQEIFQKSNKLEHFHVFLKRIFSDAEHVLSVDEEKIISLKSLPADQMWIDGNERSLNKRSVIWKGKKIPLSEAAQKIHDLANTKERRELDALVAAQFKAAAEISETEVNAVYTNKKIDDELRHYTEPYDDTVRKYRNDPVVVKQLVETVTAAFPLVHRFFKIKSRLLKLKTLTYADRKIGIGKITKKFSFDDSVKVFKKVLGDIDQKYVAMFDDYLKKGQLDVAPRVGKVSGAYCASTFLNPTFVLLNHTDTFNSFSTLAHEMGHAFHGELCQSQGPIYSSYSMSLAETASTLFETIAIDAVAGTLSEKEKIVALHDRISDDIATVFRQISCFNFELDLHTSVRAKGFLPKEEIAALHNKHMKAYLGPLFTFTEDDGYFFVTWSHLRRFFYVYSYAYGQLVSKALIRRYRQDPKFWTLIEKFLSSGGKASPEEILFEIGIDVSKPAFWKEGLKEIEEDIAKLEKLVAKGK